MSAWTDHFCAAPPRADLDPRRDWRGASASPQVVGRGGAVLLLLAVVAGIAVARRADLGSGAALAVRAAERLVSEPVALSGRFVDGLGVVNNVDAVLTGDGVATLHVERPGDGSAEFRSDGSGVLLKGDESFWLSVRPDAAMEYAGDWVELPPDHDLYAGLRPLLDAAALAALLERTDWESGELLQAAGVRVQSLVSGDLTALVEADDPHRLLALTGSSPAPVAQRDTLLIASLEQPPLPEAAASPYWDLSASQPSPEQVRAAQEQVQQSGPRHLRHPPPRLRSPLPSWPSTSGATRPAARLALPARPSRRGPGAAAGSAGARPPGPERAPDRGRGGTQRGDEHAGSRRAVPPQGAAGLGVGVPRPLPRGPAQPGHQRPHHEPGGPSPLVGPGAAQPAQG